MPWHAPAKTKRGGHFGSLQECGFPGQPNLQTHSPKLGEYRFSSMKWKWNDVRYTWNNSYLNCGCRWKWRMIIAVNFPIQAIGKRKLAKIRPSTGFKPVEPHIGSEVNLLYLPWGVKWCEVYIIKVICIGTEVVYESDEWSSTAMITPPLSRWGSGSCSDYIFFKEAIIRLLYSYTPEMTKDWGSMVEEEEEKGSRMETRNKTNSRYMYYIICKMKQQLSPGLKYTLWVTTFRNGDFVINFNSECQWWLWL